MSGRDRNAVDEEELSDAVAFVLTHCPDRPALRRLLEPLRGSRGGGGGGGGAAVSPAAAAAAAARPSRPAAPASWLLRKPDRFMLRVLEAEREFVLREVFGFAPGTVGARRLPAATSIPRRDAQHAFVSPCAFRRHPLALALALAPHAFGAQAAAPESC